MRDAADELLAGMETGTILDRSGKPYKPPTCRSYRQALDAYILPEVGDLRLSAVTRRRVQDLLDDLWQRGLAPSTIHNKLDPLRVIFRRAIRRDELAVDPTDNLELPAVRGKRDRIEAPAQAAKLIAAVPEDDRAFWTVALFCGLRRGELRALRWHAIDFEENVIHVERGWDDEEGEIELKSEAGLRVVPMAGRVRKALAAHKLRSGRDGDDLVFGRTATLPFIPSTVRRRALEAWKHADLEPLTPHEARHCAISYFIACGYDWKQVSVWAGHSDVRQTWNRYGKVIPGAAHEAGKKLDAYLDRTIPQTIPREPEDDETRSESGFDEYRHGDSNPGFRRERAAS